MTEKEQTGNYILEISVLESFDFDKNKMENYEYFFLFVIVFCNIIPCKKNAHQEMQGIVQFLYIKGEDDHYWLSKKVLKTKKLEYYLIEDATPIMANMLLSCEDLLKEFFGKEKMPSSVMNIFDTEQYQSQNREKREFGFHYGGDVYRIDKDTIVISFKVKADAVIFESQLCDNVFSNSPYSCPIEKEKIFFPVAVLLNIKDAKSLSNAYLKKNNYAIFEKEYFSRKECD